MQQRVKLCGRKYCEIDYSRCEMTPCNGTCFILPIAKLYKIELNLKVGYIGSVFVVHVT